MDFKFNQKGQQWHYKTVEDIDYQFIVNDHTNTIHPLQQFKVNHGCEIIGVIHLSPNGNNREVIKELRLKCKTWTDHIQGG